MRLSTMIRRASSTGTPGPMVIGGAVMSSFTFMIASTYPPDLGRSDDGIPGQPFCIWA
jgi:hypothetical protein